MNSINRLENSDFSQLVEGYQQGDLDLEKQRFGQEFVCPVKQGDIVKIEADSREYPELKRLGEMAIVNNRYGALFFNGGMASRFGMGPKGILPFVNQKSFLQIKVEDVLENMARLKARALCTAQFQIPIYILNSFYTDVDSRQYVTEHQYFGLSPDQILFFLQYDLPRVSPGPPHNPLPKGEIIRDELGNIAYAGSGHGDFFFAFKDKRSFGGQISALNHFRARGGKYLFASNIDNMGAFVDPAILGFHIQSGADMTFEVSAKLPGDKGGAPARVKDHLQIVEQFLFPAPYLKEGRLLDIQTQIPVFNCLTFIINADIFEKDLKLPYYPIMKKFNGQNVIQFERLAGDLTAPLGHDFAVNYLEVPRTRFVPVKNREELPGQGAFYFKARGKLKIDGNESQIQYGENMTISDKLSIRIEKGATGKLTLGARVKFIGDIRIDVTGQGSLILANEAQVEASIVVRDQPIYLG